MERTPVLQPRKPAPAAPSVDSPPAAEPGASSSPDVDTLEGKTTIDDKSSIECEILCYSAIGRIAARIAGEFNDYLSKSSDDAGSVCVIFLDDMFKAAFALRRSVVFQIDLLKRGFEQLLSARPKGVPLDKAQFMIMPFLGGAQAGIAATAAFGRSVIDLLSMFRADVSYAGRSVTVKETSLVFELARNLRREKRTFLYPRLLLYPLSSTERVSANSVEKSLMDLFEIRERVVDIIRPFAAEVAGKESALADLVARLAEKHKNHDHSQDHSLNEEISTFKQGLVPQRLDLDGLRAQFEALDARLKALQAGLVAPDEKSALVPLHLVQQAEEVLARFGGDAAGNDPAGNATAGRRDTYFLWAEVETAGGSYRITRNLWQTLFGNDDGLSYSGGAIVTYAFFDRHADVVLSGTHRYREPFTRFPITTGVTGHGNSFGPATGRGASESSTSSEVEGSGFGDDL